MKVDYSPAFGRVNYIVQSEYLRGITMWLLSAKPPAQPESTDICLWRVKWKQH